MIEMPKVIDCTASSCSYNDSHTCHAKAITIGDSSDLSEPKCDTFFQSSIHGGIKDLTAGVGACKISDCSFNDDLECNAHDIKVGMENGNADCLTFKSR
jgi:hypothetical protein